MKLTYRCCQHTEARSYAYEGKWMEWPINCCLDDWWLNALQNLLEDVVEFNMPYRQFSARFSEHLFWWYWILCFWQKSSFFLHAPCTHTGHQIGLVFAYDLWMQWRCSRNIGLTLQIVAALHIGHVMDTWGYSSILGETMNGTYLH